MKHPGLSGPYVVDMDAAEYYLGVLEAMRPPARRLGIGPYREDYASQDAYEKAKSPSVAIGQQEK